MTVSSKQALTRVMDEECINFASDRATRIIKRLHDYGFEVTAISNPNVDDGEVQRMIQDEI